MVKKDIVISEIVNYINSKLDAIYKNNPLANIFVEPYVSEAINANISKLDSFLSMVTREDGMIDIDKILNGIMDKLVTANINNIKGISINNGDIKLDIPFINKSLVLNNKDIEELKTKLNQYK